jgi:hypothetical protein
VVALAGARIGLGVGAMSAFVAAAIGLVFAMKLGTLHQRKEPAPRSPESRESALDGAEVAEVAV